MDLPSEINLDVEDEYKSIYKKHYQTIRTRVTKGRLRTVYHFLVTGDYSRNKAKEYISEIDMELNRNNTYKINVAFGFILRNHRTGDLRFFHPSQNSMLYELPMKVKNRKDIKKILDDLESEDARAYAMAHRPSTVWRMEKIVCVRFDVYKLATQVT
jgi:hypothetical protein